MSGQTLRVMSWDLIALIVTAVQRGMSTLELEVTPEGQVVVSRSYGDGPSAKEAYELCDDTPRVCPLCFIEQIACLLNYNEGDSLGIVTGLREGIQANTPAKIVMSYSDGGWGARLVFLPTDRLYRTMHCARHLNC